MIIVSVHGMFRKRVVIQAKEEAETADPETGMAEEIEISEVMEKSLSPFL